MFCLKAAVLQLLKKTKNKNKNNGKYWSSYFQKKDIYYTDILIQLKKSLVKQSFFELSVFRANSENM